ncbi:hypothetical protein E8E95_19965 [Pseudomonas sp. BN414]|uniref:TraR/DksA C4-type zinc finger protein n=1 Tax=Pseudomonas sp. BN414 TaxID=2567888 RepID=UPI00245720DA|nr:TraR/DksA C4-type zinc finger protein [Pseudomonas sp. BN414]MDH4568969.1 hypothetical protein [Pseudomonas sp. BN414]
MRIIARERADLMVLDTALERIKDDSFGFCEETGLSIGLQRLLLNPAASLTIDAQTRLKQRQMHSGHRSKVSVTDSSRQFREKENSCRADAGCRDDRSHCAAGG